MQADLPPPPVTAVETVVVTAPRLPPLPGDAAYSAVRVMRDQLLDQVRTDEAIKQVPGVSLFRRTSSGAANATTQGLSLRAIAPSGAGRALITLDGAPLNDPFGGWVLWAQVPPESLEAAYVVRGAGAGPYGAGALTGVVALDELSGPGAISAEVSGGERGQGRAAAASVIDLGESSLFLTAASERDDGWTPVRLGRGAADTPLDYRSWAVAGRFQAPLLGGSLAVRLGAFEEDKGAGLAGARSRAIGQSAVATYAAQPSKDAPGWRLQGWVRRSDFANTSVAVAPGRAFTTPANDQYATPALGYGFNAAVRGGEAGWTWEAGADLRAADGEVREFNRNLGAGFTRERWAGGRTLVAGVYAEASREAGPWLATAGARIDRWSAHDGFRIERDLATRQTVFEASPADRHGATPTARAAIRRDLGGGLSARTAAYAGFRPPTLNELHRPFRVGNDITEANPGLEPERLYGVEAGLDGGVGRLGWSATLFHNRLVDPIANVTVGAGPGVFPDYPGAGFVPAGGVLRQRRNAGAIEAWGVEAEARYALGERLALRAAVAYTRAEVDGGTEAPQLTGLRPAQAPALTVTAGAEWRATERLTLSADLRHEGTRFEDDLNSRELAAATAVDLRGEWRLTKAATVFAAVDNAFDAAIQTGETGDGIESFDAPRTVRFGVTWRR